MSENPCHTLPGDMLRGVAFQDKTLMLGRDRVRDLCDHFAVYADAFDAERLFTGPSLFFHHKTISLLRQHEGSAVACLDDDQFFESLYATLASWGLHRMGPGNTKLVDLDDMIVSFRAQRQSISELTSQSITEIPIERALSLSDSIWRIISSLKVGIGQTKIVSGSKALHHLLPDLVPPIDREYVVRFFFNNTLAIQSREQEAFRVMYAHFIAIAKTCGVEIRTRLGSGMNTSVTKAIDNAIVGYGRLRLKTKED